MVWPKQYAYLHFTSISQENITGYSYLNVDITKRHKKTRHASKEGFLAGRAGLASLEVAERVPGRASEIVCERTDIEPEAAEQSHFEWAQQSQKGAAQKATEHYIIETHVLLEVGRL